MNLLTNILACLTTSWGWLVERPGAEGSLGGAILRRSRVAPPGQVAQAAVVAGRSDGPPVSFLQRVRCSRSPRTAACGPGVGSGTCGDRPGWAGRPQARREGARGAGPAVQGVCAGRLCRGVCLRKAATAAVPTTATGRRSAVGGGSPRDKERRHACGACSQQGSSLSAAQRRAVLGADPVTGEVVGSDAVVRALVAKRLVAAYGKRGGRYLTEFGRQVRAQLEAAHRGLPSRRAGRRGSPRRLAGGRHRRPCSGKVGGGCGGVGVAAGDPPDDGQWS